MLEAANTKQLTLTVALSTVEVEYVAMSQCAQKMAWMKLRSNIPAPALLKVTIMGQ